MTRTPEWLNQRCDTGANFGRDENLRRFGSSRFGSIPESYETGHFLAKTPESYGKNSRITIRVQKFRPVSADTGRNEHFLVDTGDFGRRYGSSAHIVYVHVLLCCCAAVGI